MKKITLITISLILMFSCKKENSSQSTTPAYLSNVIASLKVSLSDNDFANISTQKAFITPINSRTYVRIPFKGKDISKDFILLQTDNSGRISSGFIINLNKIAEEKDKAYQFNGFITKSSLDRKIINTSYLINGVINHAYSRSAASRDIDFSFPIPKDTVIIVTTGDIPTDGGGGISYSDWISVSGIFGYYGNYSSYGSFGAMGEFLYGGGGMYSGMSGNTPNSGGTHSQWSQPEIQPDGSEIINTEALFVDFEFVENLSAIDVVKYFKGFSTIPDEGSICSIEIFTDIPVDKDPNKFFNWQTQSPGHTFIQVKKGNGNSTIVQNIGFYPEVGWKTLLTTTPVASKFVDNSEHEFNASLKMMLTPEELKKSLSEIENLSKFVKYDIDEFNCTDFALHIFNSARVSNPLEIPKYDIPGGTALGGSNTPQGLYNKLKSMQLQGMESENISIPGVKGWVGTSDGPF